MKKLLFVLSAFSALSAQAYDSVQHPLRELSCTVYEWANGKQLKYEIVSSEYWAARTDTETPHGMHDEGEFGIQKDDRSLGGLLQIRFIDNGERRIAYRPKKDVGQWISSSATGYAPSLSLTYDAGPYVKNSDKVRRAISIHCELRNKAKN